MQKDKLQKDDVQNAINQEFLNSNLKIIKNTWTQQKFECLSYELQLRVHQSCHIFSAIPILEVWNAEFQRVVKQNCHKLRIPRGKIRHGECFFIHSKENNDDLTRMYHCWPLGVWDIKLFRDLHSKPKFIKKAFDEEYEGFCERTSDLEKLCEAIICTSLSGPYYRNCYRYSFSLRRVLRVYAYEILGRSSQVKSEIKAMRGFKNPSYFLD